MGPALTVTVAVWEIAVPLIVAETTLSPTAVELSVPVAAPFALVTGGWVRVLQVPVAARTTVAPLTALPNSSRAVTVMVLVPPLAMMVPGAAVTVLWAALTGPALTVTVAVWEIAMPLIVAETTLAPAAVELSVPVAAPVAPVGPAGWVRVLPVPVAARTTVAPLTGLPNSSRAVTVMMLVPEPVLAPIVPGAAVTVLRAALMGPALTVTVAVWGIAVPLIVAETTLAPAPVELSVPVAAPFASVGPAGWVRVLPVPVAARTTVAPLTGLPKSSRAVTVMMLLPEPVLAPIAPGAAETVLLAALTAPTPTVTVVVWGIAVPLIVPETTLAPATVELSVPVATPVAPVGPPGWVRVLPVPVAARTTVAPLTGLPNSSRAVTVMVLVLEPVLAPIVPGAAVTVLRAALTGPILTVTVAV